MTEREAVDALWRYFQKACTMAVPNTAVLGPETDFLTISKAGLLHAVEVKVSVSDFMAEHRAKPGGFKEERRRLIELTLAAKGDPVVGWTAGGPFHASRLPADVVVNEKGRVQGTQYVSGQIVPHRFSYAYPHDLAEKLDPLVPAWAGIIYLGYHTYTVFDWKTYRYTDKETTKSAVIRGGREAKQIHKHRLATERVMAIMRRTLHYRVWAEREKTQAALDRGDAT